MDQEAHRSGRTPWLRAAVLGAEDGLVSTASLLLGVAAASASQGTIVVTGFAGLVAGAMSMAAGEYVSVASQRDAENADIALERRQQERNPAFELQELTDIYIRRGLGPKLAHKVAVKLMAIDPLGAHLREELGFTEETMARPVQAAVVSAVSFAIGAGLPLAVVLVTSEGNRMAAIATSTLVLLALVGAIGGQLGGAPRLRAMVRVLVGGGLAMAVTALIGRLVGAAV